MRGADRDVYQGVFSVKRENQFMGVLEDAFIRPINQLKLVSIQILTGAIWISREAVF